MVSMTLYFYLRRLKMIDNFDEIPKLPDDIQPNTVDEISKLPDDIQPSTVDEIQKLPDDIQKDVIGSFDATEWVRQRK